MNIVDFNRSHIENALEIARANYEEERLAVPALPKLDSLPDLGIFIDNQLGVAAFDGDRMLGFLCAYNPWDNAFGCTNVKGTFSPIHAHGVLTTAELTSITRKQNLNRDRIYSLLYQEAARKWVKAGIKSHCIALYAHDGEAETSFFYNCFGLRCIDAIRSLSDSLDPVDTELTLKGKIKYCEIPRSEWGNLLAEHNGLIAHLGDSPVFMKYDLIGEEELYRRAPADVRYFVAKVEDRSVAYIKISNNGENFVTESTDMQNICGAYCQPAYRGTGIYHNLLGFLINTLREDGYKLLGVDCESFNPTARGFWLKYFSQYTHSLARRIDENAFIAK